MHMGTHILYENIIDHRSEPQDVREIFSRYTRSDFIYYYSTGISRLN
jgi:hypothetical protein